MRAHTRYAGAVGARKGSPGPAGSLEHSTGHPAYRFARAPGSLVDMTVAAPTWTILVPTLGERRALFMRLMDVLLPQLDHCDPSVHVSGWFNNGKPSLPTIRQTMISRADTDYVSFVDDDDLVSPDYVSTIMDALAERPDYVGFQVQCYSDGAPIAIAHHSLEFTRWRNLPGRFERDISHLNPIRTTLARTARFDRARAGQAEDRDWAAQLRRKRSVRTQTYIPRVMYHYLYSTSRVPGMGSRWERGQTITPGERPVIDHPRFSWSADA